MKNEKTRLVWCRGCLWPENHPALVINRSSEGYLMDPATSRPWVGTDQQARELEKRLISGKPLFGK